ERAARLRVGAGAAGAGRIAAAARAGRRVAAARVGAVAAAALAGLRVAETAVEDDRVLEARAPARRRREEKDDDEEKRRAAEASRQELAHGTGQRSAERSWRHAFGTVWAGVVLPAGPLQPHLRLQHLANQRVGDL